MSAAFIKVNYRSATTGMLPFPIQGLLTKFGVLLSLLQYHSECKKSVSTQGKINHAIKLLLNYISYSDISFNTPTILLRSFREALIHGTIDYLFYDPTGLYWCPRSNKAVNTIIANITHYTDWLARQPGHIGIINNPIRQATSSEEHLNWCAYHHRLDNSLLNHLQSSDGQAAVKYVREVGKLHEETTLIDEVKRFPEGMINTLIDDGLVVAGSTDSNGYPQPDYKCQAMTILMHYGSVRVSELFHIYLCDIDIDIERMEGVVRIYNPATGAAPEKGYSNRKDYLLRRYKLKPRTEYLKSECLHAGWKDPLLDHQDKYMEIRFFPPSKASEFLLAFRKYLIHQRVEPKHRQHPYAFTNSKGEPETRKNFRRLHAAAVKRIGLKRGKYHGTTEHGHRHAYGYRLAKAGFGKLDIQKAMHHKSPESCEVYTQPSSSDIRELMRKHE